MRSSREVVLSSYRALLGISLKFGKLYPLTFLEQVEKHLRYAGIRISAAEFLGLSTLYSFSISALVTVALTILFRLPLAAALPLLAMLFGLAWALFYATLLYVTERRASSVEKFLPDALCLISQNISSGMTPYSALLSAARPELGPLALEIQTVAKDVLSGRTLDEALFEMCKRVRSTKLERSVRLISQGIRSGGDLARVLQQIAEGMRREKSLMTRLRGELSAQAAFITFCLIFAAPLLFAAALEFMEISSKLWRGIQIPELSERGVVPFQMPMLPMPSPEFMKPELFFTYALAILGVLNFFGALFLGILRTGKAIYGLVLAPFLVTLSIGIFITLKSLIHAAFGAIVI